MERNNEIRCKYNYFQGPDLHHESYRLCRSVQWELTVLRI